MCYALTMDTNGRQLPAPIPDSPKSESKFDVYKFDIDEFVDYWFRTRKGKIVIGQKPNAPIIAYSCAKTAERVLPRGKLRDGAGLAADVSLTYWALLELFDGVNRFRKLMGFATLFGMVSSKVFDKRD